MKVKYTFDKVDTSVDTIKVSCRGYQIMNFSAADYGEKFKDLEGRDFFLSPLDCNDVAELDVSGNENHAPSYSEETRERWLVETHNLLGSKHFDDTELFKTFTNDTPIKVFNQEDDFDYNSFIDANGKGLRKALPDMEEAIPGGFMLDFSNIKVNSRSSYKLTEFVPPSSLNKKYNEYSTYGYVSSNKRIVKWFDLSNVEDSTVSKIDFSSNGNYPLAITEAPDLHGFTSPTMVCDKIYKKCTNLVYAGDNALPPNCTSAVEAFSGCTNLVKSDATLKGNCTAAFKGCTSLEAVGDISSVTTTYSYNIGSMFENCQSLKEYPVGYEDIRALSNGTTDSYGNHTTAYEYMFKNCTSLTEFKLPKEFFDSASTIKSANLNWLQSMFYGCTGIKTIDIVPITTLVPMEIASGTQYNMFAGTAIDIDHYGDLDLSKGIYPYSIGNTLESLGVVNLCAGSPSYASEYGVALTTYSARLTIPSSGYTTACLSSYIFKNSYKVKALPYYLCSSILDIFNTKSFPSSTGYEWWVDYHRDDTDYVKSITRKAIEELHEDVGTTEPSTTYTFKVPYTSLLQKVDTYEPTFEPTSITFCYRESYPKQNPGSYGKGGNVDIANMVFTPNDEDKTLDITMPCTNIKDGSESSWSCDNFVIGYVALIDGHEFHGATVLNKLSLSITWDIQETIDYTCTLVDDDGNPINLAAPEVSEPVEE